MNRIILSLLSITLYLTLTIFTASTSHANEPSYGMPSTIDSSANYLFFLHNYYVEMKGPDGDCKYYDILKAFSKEGFVVISEIRSKNVSPVEYAKKATVNIKKILDAGVPQENITVAGHSKGGVIAIQIAALLEKPKANYVILAGCGIKPLEKAYPDFNHLKGNFLSVYATSDTIARSCKPDFLKSKQGIFSKEITLESPEGHRLFFKPTDLWFDLVIAWLKSAIGARPA
jgi:hypothetical protein